jgi:hypothetical protein
VAQFLHEAPKDVRGHKVEARSEVATEVRGS